MALTNDDCSAADFALTAIEFRIRPGDSLTVFAGRENFIDGARSAKNYMRDRRPPKPVAAFPHSGRSNPSPELLFWSGGDNQPSGYLGRGPVGARRA